MAEYGTGMTSANKDVGTTIEVASRKTDILNIFMISFLSK